jgi:hypothetical protein
MRKHILVIAALTALMAVAGGGVAIASHVTEVDPATVPPGTSRSPRLRGRLRPTARR